MVPSRIAPNEERSPWLVERAASLVPMLLAQAPAAEQARRVSDASFDALSKAGIFRMTAPKRYGGAEADFQTQCEVLAHLARGCPSTSWVATIFSAMSWLAATFPDQAQEEIFADGDPRISGVFSPTGTGVRKDGGLVVSGRWGFNTGCHGAKWTILNAVVGTGADAVPTCVIARSRELTIVDDWYATGMSATGSNTIVADNVFVPAHRCLPLPDMLEARLPPGTSGNPYFNYPLSPVLTVNAGGTPLGMAQGALEGFLARLPGRGIAYTFYTNKSEAPVTHLQVAEARLTLESADAHVRTGIRAPGRPCRRPDVAGRARQVTRAHRVCDGTRASGGGHALLRERRLVDSDARARSSAFNATCRRWPTTRSCTHRPRSS